jgi:glycosyltransferase involved in cell wall biosynthesis
VQLVSVIIPCYNAASFICKTIQAVFNQSYQNFEIIVVNDGSTDSSPDLIKSIVDDRIRMIDKANSGVADTRNVGLAQAKGKYILFLDADDIISKDYLLSAVEVLENNPAIDFCTFYIKHIDEADMPLNIADTRGSFQNIQKEIAEFNPAVSACPSAYVYKKNSLEIRVIYFNVCLKSPEDRHFLFQVGKYLKGAIIPKEKAFLNYRINQNSLSHRKSDALLLMQEAFYQITIKNKLLSGETEKIFSKKMAYQLIATFVKLKNYKKTVQYVFIYLKNV